VLYLYIPSYIDDILETFILENINKSSHPLSPTKQLVRRYYSHKYLN